MDPGLTDKQIVGIMWMATLREKFPRIDWKRMFDLPTEAKNIILNVEGSEIPLDANPSSDNVDPERIVDTAEDDRQFKCSGIAGTKTVNLADFVDPQTSVDVEMLMDLELMPKFLGDIETAIRKGLPSTDWTEGYNKKLKVPLGNFNAGHGARNLIILDISGSIPDGISSTMLTLIDTLRHRCKADLIITASTSKYWKWEDALPNPGQLRGMFNYGNESYDFENILCEDILGKTWDNVLCFGDNDTCIRALQYDIDRLIAAGLDDTKVGRLYSFHTRRKVTPGYARWITDLRPDMCDDERYDISWAKWLGAPQW
jgi:hypothetical protein